MNYVYCISRIALKSHLNRFIFRVVYQFFFDTVAPLEQDQKPPHQDSSSPTKGALGTTLRNYTLECTSV